MVRQGVSEFGRVRKRDGAPSSRTSTGVTEEESDLLTE